jgi:hypothetical protein
LKKKGIPILENSCVQAYNGTAIKLHGRVNLSGMCPQFKWHMSKLQVTFTLEEYVSGRLWWHAQLISVETGPGWSMEEAPCVVDGGWGVA